MLYIVATPIGNLEDLSIRQAKTLMASDVILTEDTRKTGILLEKINKLFGLKRKGSQRLVSYYREVEFEKLPQVIEYLEEGKEVGLISEAGMPLISDPGWLLVKTAIKKNLALTVIPGPTAETVALVYSGFRLEKYLFLGFAPKKTNDRKKMLLKIAEIKKLLPETVFVFYDSPWRINETLALIDEMIPDSDLSISRELTKMFEETVRGKAKDLKGRQYKGEITVVVK
jgi:16S rRNA (cytidine1402-2'-O)-methyltransferase